MHKTETKALQSRVHFNLGNLLDWLIGQKHTLKKCIHKVKEKEGSPKELD